MSIFDSTNPSAGDSNYTKKVKARLTEIIKNLLNKKGFKTWIKEEVPLYVIGELPFHLDLGILARNREMDDLYSFFGVEIDYKTHESKRSDDKDAAKEKVFWMKGIPLYRIRVEKIIGDKKWDLPTIESDIWDFLNDKDAWIRAEQNRELAVKLKENALAKCRNTNCKHPAQNHNLAGCNFQQPNKAKDYCYCREPHFISDM